MTEVRPEVVARLASTALVDLPNVIAEEEPTSEELSAAADTLAIMHSGRRVQTVPVLNLRLSQLQALAATYGVLERATPGAWANDDPTISDRLKLLPGEFAHHVTKILASVGLLDPADVAGDR